MAHRSPRFLQSYAQPRKAFESARADSRTRAYDELGGNVLVSSYFDVTERNAARSEIEVMNRQLEERVKVRTAELQTTNESLSEALDVLRMTQNQLVQSEKLAALGGLVAGIAHELNTPLGNGLTVASALSDLVGDFSSKVEIGLRRSDLQAFVQESKMAAELLQRNLEKAVALVSSFKQVSADQTSSQRRPFNLNTFLGELLATLSPTIRKSSCTVDLDIPADLWLESFPGPLGQVLSNLVNNAIIHAYENIPGGVITISANMVDDGFVDLFVRDTGVGIATHNLSRVFDPFFTTKLGKGGSGLGLHIVHNIVCNILGGSIVVESQLAHGSVFKMRLPSSAPEIAGCEV